MSDQPLTSAFLDQFFRSFARAELDPAFEDKMEESRERGQRLYVRTVTGSVEFLESMYGFLHADVHRLERRLDDIHVRMERRDPGDMAHQVEVTHDYFDDVVATWTRLRVYVPDVGKTIDRIAEGLAKGRLQAQTLDLRRRVDALAPDLDTARMRLNRYTQRAG